MLPRFVQWKSEKVGTGAVERGEAGMGSCADELGDDGDDAGFEERKKNVAAALFGFFEMRLGVAKGIASQNELRRGDRHSRDAHVFERGGKETGAEAFAKGGEAVEKISTGGDAGVNRNFVKQIAAQELQLAADTKAIMFTELQIMKHIEVKVQDELGFAAGGREFAIGKSARGGKQMIGGALHGGGDHGDGGGLRRGASTDPGSGHSLLSRSRGNRHGRLGGNSLGGERNHTGRKNSTRGDGCEEKVWEWRRKRPRGPPPDPSTGFSLVPGSSFGRETPVRRKESEDRGFQVDLRLAPS